MENTGQYCKRALLGLALFAGALGARAQDSTAAATPPEVARQQASEIARGDPARWFVADESMAARLKTLHKEIGAALQEAQTACKKGPAAERSSCLKEARQTYQHDMAASRELLAASPQER